MGQRASATNHLLFVAAERGDLGAVRAALRPRMLWRKPDVNVRNGDGWTPLHQAAAYGQVAVARTLLDHGARVEARNYLGLAPLDYAACYGHEAVAELLVAHGARHTAHTAACLGVIWALGHLLLRKSDLNRHDYFGYTPLHWAARHGRFDAAKLLLGRGADPNALDVNGETPLHRAVEWGHDQVTALLRAHGAVAEVARGECLAV